MSNSHSVVENVKKASEHAQVDVSLRAHGTGSDPVELRQAIATLAYRYAESRNFEPGHEMEDWLNAENKVLVEKESLKGLPA